MTGLHPGLGATFSFLAYHSLEPTTSQAISRERHLEDFERKAPTPP
jgi:hypothetical protein